MMSHLFLQLFLQLPALIYFLDFIRGYTGIACHEALSYAKFMSQMSSLPSAIPGVPLHFTVGEGWWRRQQPSGLVLTLGSFMDKAAATNLSRV